MSGKQPKRKARAGVDAYGRIPLHYSALAGDEATVIEALNSGAPVDAQDDNGWTPLHFAAQSGHSRIVEELLRRGANSRLCNSHGNDPLWIAVMHARHNPATHRLLVAAGATPALPNHHGRSARDIAEAFGVDLSETTNGAA